MPEFFHAGQCPSCRQGRLFLQRNETSGDIYAHCEDCETGYMTPVDLETPHGGFLTLLDGDYETANPTLEDISRTVWANYTVRAVR